MEFNRYPSNNCEDSLIHKCDPDGGFTVAFLNGGKYPRDCQRSLEAIFLKGKHCGVFFFGSICGDFTPEIHDMTSRNYI